MKKRLLILFLMCFSFSASADDWTLGVMEFPFKQNQKRAESSTQAASVLPQLIIEQFSSGNTRNIPHKESLDRKLKELQKERLSLFLQLSKEYKVRDSLVLTNEKPRALKKAIEKQMTKIREIEIKIDENLDRVKKEIDEAAPKIAYDESVSEGKKDDEKKKDGMRPFPLPFPFFHRNEADQIVTENVVIYKNDSTVLFKPSEKALDAGFSSWDFEQEVLDAKINGLITGEITCYGDYCSVTTTLRLYPGGKIYGTVSEVGLLSDLMPLANSIAQNLDSKIANSLPIVIEFDIEPREIAQDAKVMIDDTVFSLRKKDGSFDNSIIMESGIHHINIESPGYESMAFTYNFSDDNRFFVHTNLVPEVHGLAKIRLKKYRDGVFHTYGFLQSPVTEQEKVTTIEVNNKKVLGVFVVPKKNKDDSDSSTIAFFTVAPNRAFDGVNLVVNAKPFDREANIDKRRRWMYTAYTALICSLPFTFYNLGEFTAENYAYSQGRGDYEHLLDLQKRANTCVMVTSVFGIWAGIELVRYLWAADRVLPAKAKVDRNASKYQNLFVPPEPESVEAQVEEPDEAMTTENEESGTIIENDEILVN